MSTISELELMINVLNQLIKSDKLSNDETTELKNIFIKLSDELLEKEYQKQKEEEEELMRRPMCRFCKIKECEVKSEDEMEININRFTYFIYCFECRIESEKEIIEDELDTLTIF